MMAGVRTAKKRQFFVKLQGQQHLRIKRSFGFQLSAGRSAAICLVADDNTFSSLRGLTLDANPNAWLARTKKCLLNRSGVRARRIPACHTGGRGPLPLASVRQPTDHQ